MTVLVRIQDAGVKMAEPMDKNTGHEILKRLARLIKLMEEQNDILLYDNECCCPSCDGDCGEED